MIRNNFKFLLFILIICAPIILCKFDYKTLKVTSTKTSITYEFSPSSDYFDSLIFQTNVGPYQLNFSCNLSQTVRRCSADQISNDSLKKIYGNINYCMEDDCLQILIQQLYPAPIVYPDLRPSTRGGLTLFQGSFLKFQNQDYFFFPDGNRIPIATGYTTLSNSFDPTNITLDYPSGCGFQQIIWSNGQYYNFSYVNPTILNATFVGNEITINGLDFCSNQFQVKVLIDNVEVTSIISHDHEFVKFNYNEIYSKKSNVKLITSNVTSIEKQIEFPPEPIHINSVPKSKGGVVTITGYRLSSENSSTPISVSIGNLECLNVKSTPTELLCNLKPVTSNVAANDLPVSFTIGGIKNQNSLVFNFDIPFLNPIYYLPDGNLNVTGDCLGDTSRTSIFLNGTETKLSDLFIDKTETMLSFKLDRLSKVNLVIKVNGVSSNTLVIDGSFYASSPNTLPSTNGGNVIFTLFHIKPVNFNEIPSITIHPDGKPIKGVLSGTPSNKEIQSFSFQIPAGCGEKDTVISIGNQLCSVKLKYQPPMISDCSVSNDGTTASCHGDFGNPSFFNTLNVQFSDDQIDSTIVNNSFTFPLKLSYRTNPVFLEICNVQAIPMILNISQTLSNQTNYSFNTTGGTFYLYGEHLMSQTNASVTCDDQTFKSKYENSSVISFEIIIDGPYDLNCKYSFDNGKNESDFTLIYPSPSISNTSKIELSGGPLTIYGDNFYSNISNCKITIGNINECQDITFINSNIIKCNLPPFNSNIEEGDYENQFINLSYNNLKNCTSKISIIGNSNFNSNDQSSTINSNETKSNQENNKKSSKLKTIVPAVICPILFIAGIIILSILLKRKLKNDLKKKELELIDMRNQSKIYKQQQQLEEEDKRLKQQKEKAIESGKQSIENYKKNLEIEKEKRIQFKEFEKNCNNNFNNNNNNNVNDNEGSSSGGSGSS